MQRVYCQSQFFLTADKIKEKSEPVKTVKESKSKLPTYIPRNISSKLAQFDDKYLYFGLISHTGCSIILKVSSIPSREYLNKKKLENQQLALQQKFNQMGSFVEEMNENGNYYDEMIQMERKKKNDIERHK